MRALLPAPLLAGHGHRPAQVIRTGRPGLIPAVTMEMLRAYAPDGLHGGDGQANPISSLCVPLTARGRSSAPCR